MDNNELQYYQNNHLTVPHNSPPRWFCCYKINHVWLFVRGGKKNKRNALCVLASVHTDCLLFKVAQLSVALQKPFVRKLMN